MVSSAAPTTVTLSLGLGSTAIVEQPGFQVKQASGSIAADAPADHNNKPSAVTIALIVVVSVLAAGYIVIAALYFRSRNSRSSRTVGSTYVKTGSTYAPEGMMGEKQQRERLSFTNPYDPPSSGQ